ncbi:MAG: hypothetical protein A2Z91_03280 [Deltaproteobacteria bacterium GWA2_38_16]|nr:MAG: hypothetical protein A2Z91_03280 [Deltaproteobacteria bacterium GWA2_38_16]OGQ02907.1 MAG: hypothetical protein A3D19_06710 [Deltaproteobacteria bacterium RIFCSPHIGHO2_02_FULL_38_15]OGQ35081.1 MAG: hypothetical protein A3A72_03470 [Deltaproteobacteria bacterium RIFCSPLOWO2_01_FULL_38_9]HBQ21755.1 hypothetical protein [Deltaproteobacteria bacterium]
MDSETQKGAWLPLLEYAVKKGMSLSTLRRRIRANKIQYELREGKYYLFDDGSFPLEDPEKVISDLKEQIADLKTLVQVLEAKQ